MAQKIDFENTEVAFAAKSNFDLIGLYWLFKSFSYPSLIQLGPKVTNFALKFHLPISKIVKETIFRHFCGGENLKECHKLLQKLQKVNISAILDYAIEGQKTELDFETALAEMISTINFAKDIENIEYCVFKVTAIGRFDLLEKIHNESQLTESEISEYERIRLRVEKLCKKALDNNLKIMIDAEETWIQKAIDDLAFEMMIKFNKGTPVVYNTIQMYRKDRLKFIHQYHRHANEFGFKLGIKLVRGAYLEKETERARELGYENPLNSSYEETNRCYNEALKYIVENMDDFGLCAGTHNEESIKILTELMKTHNIPNDDKNVNFSQLLGMSDNISFNLATNGYKVSKYVPYGPLKQVIPYLSRRAEENSSIRGQSSRELSLIKKEMLRRGLSL